MGVTETEATIPSVPGAQRPFAIACSRLLDCCVATVAGVMVLPVLMLAIIAIKLVDPGPAFYIQNRQGKDGRPFRFFKLRTMRFDSEAWLRDFLVQNPDAKDPRVYRDASDPRILPIVGTLLRRYSIDELPQIWNVVLGDMSLVGPRALPDYHCKLLNPEFLAFRLRVRPGITGLWQIEGRNNADPSSIEMYDSKYLASRSLGTDLLILCRTVACVFRGSGL
jgi:lipopolysaccharide/colanic/teichoic acid biosynthesis glycosyltransferase